MSGIVNYQVGEADAIRLRKYSWPEAAGSCKVIKRKFEG